MPRTAARIGARLVVLLLGVAGLALAPATPAGAATPQPWWVMPSTTQGEGAWDTIQATAAGVTGISDRSYTSVDDSEFWFQVDGVFRKTRIADPGGGHVELGRDYGVSRDGRVVFVSGRLKNDSAAVYRSTNYGATFTKVFQSSQYCGISDLAANAAGTTVAFSSCGALRYSADSGASFATVSTSPMGSGPNIRDLRVVGSQVLIAWYQSGSTQLWRYNGSAYGKITAFGSVAGDPDRGISVSDDGSVIAVHLGGATSAVRISRNGGASWGTVTGASYYPSVVVSRDGTDVYLPNGYDVYRVVGTTATVYGDIRSRLMSLPSHPAVGQLTTSADGSRLFATAYKSGTSDVRNDYLLETKYGTPAITRAAKIVGSARAGRVVKARKPVAATGSYRCTVSWKVGTKQVSTKGKVRVKKAWRKKRLTLTAACHSATHRDFAQRRAVRIR
jgi:hypothetical protein